jgi:hypothetical protein
MKNNGANHAENGNESSGTQTPTSFSPGIFTDERPLHEQLASHLETCSECQQTLIQRPAGMGTVTQLCSSYQDIITVWAEKEGRVNNIVAHDEYGNQASTTVHERYPDQWR